MTTSTALNRATQKKAQTMATSWLNSRRTDLVTLPSDDDLEDDGMVMVWHWWQGGIEVPEEVLQEIFELTHTQGQSDDTGALLEELSKKGGLL